MCQLISEEEYPACGHIIECHFKHPLIYCEAPNGIPFEGDTLKNRLDIYPSRFCNEETWVDMRMRMDGRCPRCEREVKMPSVEKVFCCGHSVVFIPGGGLQDCFSPKWQMVDVDMGTGMEDRHHGETGEKASRLPFCFGWGKKFRGVDISRRFSLCPLSFSKDGRLMKKAKRAEAIQQPAVIPQLNPEDVELLEFNKVCEEMTFSWRKHSELNIWRERTLAACPRCERVWANRRAEVPAIKDIFASQTDEKEKTLGYRAQKPRGLKVGIYNEGKPLHLKAVSGQERSLEAQGSMEISFEGGWF